MLESVALITGASRGIGKSIALRLSEDGFHVMLNDLPTQHESLVALERDVKDRGGHAAICLADVSVETEVQAMVAKTVKVLGSLDVVGGPACPPGFNDLILRPALPDGRKCRSYYSQAIY